MDLHPFVTVLRGLDGRDRQRLVDALQAVAQGRDPGVAGLVEHQGLLVELAAGTPPGEPGPALDVVVNTDVAPVDVDLLTALRARFDQLDRQASIDAARLEEVRHELDAAAVARHDVVSTELSGCTADDADARRRTADQLEAALEAWSSMPTEVVVTEAWVRELMQRWDDHVRRSAASDARRIAFDRRVESASRRLADARAALIAAEAAAVPVLLSAEEENRLAELATRPVGKHRLRGSKVRSEEEQAEIDALLGRVGQPTYSAYMMYRMAPVPAPAEVAAIGVARDAVAHAEHELAVATAARNGDPELAETRDRLEAIRARAAQHLGPVLPDDLSTALAGHCQRRPNPDREAARQHLVGLASAHGLVVPDGGDDDALVQHVRGCIAEARSDAGRRAAAEQLAAELAVLEPRVARHRAALARIDGLEARAERSRRQVEELGAQISAAARPPVPTGDQLVAAVAERHHGAGGGDSPVPVVLVGGFAGVAAGALAEVLDRLEPACDRLQLVLATDRPEAAAWADQAGLRRAMLTGPAPVVA